MSWFDENKEGRNKRRRDRYKNDPVYRKKVLDRKKHPVTVGLFGRGDVEVATGLTREQLRYLEKVGVIPDVRGRDGISSRYYTSHEVNTIRQAVKECLIDAEKKMLTRRFDLVRMKGFIQKRWEGKSETAKG